MSIYTKDLFLNDVDTEIGDWTYGGISVGRLYSGCKLRVGKFCSIASGVQVQFFGKHQYNDITVYPFSHLHGQGWPPVSCTEVKGEDVHIGNDCWLASNCIIMQGAVIEDGVVIGSHSVVAGHIPAYSIAVGNPARVVRKRFPQEQIDKLLEMKWFDWPVEVIKAHLQVISSADIDGLYEIWKREIAK